MEIKGKVWCMFEQSGTFKNEFKKLGYDAGDLDIQNNFGETDYQIDLFAEIEKAYQGGGQAFGTQSVAMIWCLPSSLAYTSRQFSSSASAYLNTIPVTNPSSFR